MNSCSLFDLMRIYRANPTFPLTVRFRKSHEFSHQSPAGSRGCKEGWDWGHNIKRFQQQPRERLLYDDHKRGCGLDSALESPADFTASRTNLEFRDGQPQPLMRPWEAITPSQIAKRRPSWSWWYIKSFLFQPAQNGAGLLNNGLKKTKLRIGMLHTSICRICPQI